MDHLGFCLVVAAVLLLAAAMESSASVQPQRVWLRLGATNEEHGLAALEVADGVTEPAERAGRACRRLGVAPTQSGRSPYLYLRADPAFMHDGAFDCYVRVVYFDAGEEAWNLEYDSNDESVRAVPDRPGAFKATESLTNGDTQAWRAVDFHLPDARFANRCNGADLRVNAGPAGEVCVAEVAVFASQPADYHPAASMQPVFEPVAAGPGIEVTFGATNFPPGEPAERVADQYRALHADWFKALGVTSYESYVRWAALEPEPERWDYSVYDAEVGRLKEHGLKWVPFLIAGPVYATPEWYRAGESHRPYRCLEHGSDSAIQSLWNPDLPARVDAYLAHFAEHYRDVEIVESVLLGITGDFGEAIYPVTGGGWTGEYHTHSGYWCGDAEARAAFGRFCREAYGDLERLNAAWGTAFETWETLEMPPLSPDKQGQPLLDMSDPRQRRRWLDFVGWYRDSMTRWADLWLTAARKHFPNCEVYLCTGGDGFPTHGSDFSAQCRLAARHRAGVRITNEASDYETNLLLTRWIGTAGKFYGCYYGYEPAGAVDENGVVARIYNAAASGARQLFEYSGNVTGSPARRRNFRRTLPTLVRDRPNVEAAVFVPKTHMTLFPGQWQELLLRRPRPLRHWFDYDLLDDVLIADGALPRYRALVWLGGEVIEEFTIEAILRWVREGGTLIAAALPHVESVEGDREFFAQLFPQASANLKPGGEAKAYVRGVGEGKTLWYPGPADDPAFLKAAAEMVYGAIGPSHLRLGGRWPRLYATTLSEGWLLYNAGDEAVAGTAADGAGHEVAIEAPAHSVVRVGESEPQAEAPARWAQLTVETSVEAAEAVAEALRAVGAAGVAEVRKRGRRVVSVMAYLPATDGMDARLSEVRRRLRVLEDSQIDTAPAAISVAPVESRDWAEAWRAHFHVEHVPPNLVIKPTWESYDPQPDEIVIEMDPGMAFGTGSHPTTQMCLTALAEIIKGGERVIDVGTGTGILAIAAARLGAAQVQALDNDEAAVRAATENVRRNGVADRVTVAQGELVAAAAGPADIVVANLAQAPILKLVGHLPRYLAPGGTFIAAGLVREGLARLEAKFRAAGLELVKHIRREEWVTPIWRIPAEGVAPPAEPSQPPAVQTPAEEVAAPAEPPAPAGEAAEEPAAPEAAEGQWSALSELRRRGGQAEPGEAVEGEPEAPGATEEAASEPSEDEPA